jgi:hypothetical protein
MDYHFTHLRIGTNRLAMALNRRRNSSRNQSESQSADRLGRRASCSKLRAWKPGDSSTLGRARDIAAIGVVTRTCPRRLVGPSSLSLAIGTAASLTSGSVFFALIKDSFLTATFGVLCLGSLLVDRPLMFYINRQFVAGDDPVRLEWWNGLWQYPRFRAAQRLVTAVWGTT